MRNIDFESIDLNGCISVIGAIIRQAIGDLSNPKKKIKKSAEAFLNSSKFKDWCGMLGANPLYILETANRLAGGLCIMKSIIQKISSYQRDL